MQLPWTIINLNAKKRLKKKKEQKERIGNKPWHDRKIQPRTNNQLDKEKKKNNPGKQKQPKTSKNKSSTKAACSHQNSKNIELVWF